MEDLSLKHELESQRLAMVRHARDMMRVFSETLEVQIKINIEQEKLNQYHERNP